ncbi:MAG: thioredoxin family protein [Pseudomonadota bacterium]
MTSRLFAGLAWGAALTISACSPSATTINESKPLFVEAVDYADFTPAADCDLDVPDATYRACLDPDELYAAAVQSAQEADNPLMVVWGFEECPYCMKFKAEEMNPESPRTLKDFVSNTLSETQRDSLPNGGADFQISVLHVHVRAAAGADLAERLGVTDIARDRGWHRVWSPFVSFTRPGSDTFVAQTQFEQGEKPCNYVDDFAISLQQLDYIPEDASRKREMCAAA